jgi:hypothetical protein
MRPVAGGRYTLFSVDSARELHALGLAGSLALVEASVQTQIDRSTAVALHDDLVRRAQRVFGARLVQVIATGSRPDDAADLSSPPTDGAQVETRLRDALEIADQLLELEARSAVQAWSVGKNPMLGDRAPALVIAEDPDAVRRAARHFLANGS